MALQTLTLSQAASGQREQILAKQPQTEKAAPAMAGRFGPRSVPLFYTGLQEPPARLAWEPLPDAEAYRITIAGLSAEHGGQEPLFDTITTGEVCHCPLDRLLLEAGRPYAWSVQAVAMNGPILNATAMPSGEEGQETLQGLQGRFWLLDAETAARWQRSQSVFNPVGEADIRAIALALLMAEVGLYHQALREIKSVTAATTRTGRVALAHITQALIYRQMLARIGQEAQAEKSAATPLARFQKWAAARELYHRERANTPRQESEANVSSVEASSKIARPQRRAQSLVSRAA